MKTERKVNVIMDSGIFAQSRELSGKMQLKLDRFQEMLDLTRQFTAKFLDSEQEQWHQILEQRQIIIGEIEQIDEEICQIQNKITQELNLETFDLESVQAYITKDLYEAITVLNREMQDIVLQIRELNKEHTLNTEMAKEMVKLHILRVRSVLRPKPSYQNAARRPRFIDKNC